MSTVDHPEHYQHPSGVECIDVVEHLPFNVGNAIKYLWRAGRKGDVLEDLRKAEWYVAREIKRLERQAKPEWGSSSENPLRWIWTGKAWRWRGCPCWDTHAPSKRLCGKAARPEFPDVIGWNFDGSNVWWRCLMCTNPGMLWRESVETCTCGAKRPTPEVTP